MENIKPFALYASTTHKGACCTFQKIQTGCIELSSKPLEFNFWHNFLQNSFKNICTAGDCFVTKNIQNKSKSEIYHFRSGSDQD